MHQLPVADFSPAQPFEGNINCNHVYRNNHASSEGGELIRDVDHPFYERRRP